MIMQRQAKTLHRVLSVVLVFACAGCADSADDVETSRAVRDPQTIARELVADSLSLRPDQVSIISLEAQDFSDSSLGCPAPGMSYQQVITPGHRILVEADGRRFDVRVSGDHGKICHRRKPGGHTEPAPIPHPREAVAAFWPCATGVPSLRARLSAPVESSARSA